jgi:hypothetical protein
MTLPLGNIWASDGKTKMNIALFFDEKAEEQQRKALIMILIGKVGDQSVTRTEGSLAEIQLMANLPQIGLILVFNLLLSKIDNLIR